MAHGSWRSGSYTLSAELRTMPAKPLELLDGAEDAGGTGGALPPPEEATGGAPSPPDPFPPEPLPFLSRYL